MKTLGLCLVGLVTLALGLLLVITVDAQGEVTVTPSRLTVAGTRGVTETRTLLLRATDPITGLQIIPLDLLPTDGSTVLSAGTVHVALPSDTITAGGLLTVPVTFDLRGAPSGEFSGELLASYHGGVLTVPVTVRVKTSWPFPLGILVAGVALGVVVSGYRSRGRPRDKVLVRVGQLRAQMRGDARLSQEKVPFQMRIEAHLIDVEAMLQAEKWQDAQGAVGHAEALWVKWRKGRTDWLEQSKYHAELMGRLDDEPDVPYIQAVRRGLEETLRTAPDLEGPDKLRERLDVLAQQANRYIRIRTRLDELNVLRTHLPVDRAEPSRLRAQGFQRQLDDLKPDDDAAYQALQGEIDTAILELTQLALQPRESEMGIKGARDLGAHVPRLLAPAPSAHPLVMEEQVTKAPARLRWFTWFSYAIAVALLAAAGFGELYIANATFGAHAWGDYFALLAWGFGAEATRAAVAQMVYSWGLPGVE